MKSRLLQVYEHDNIQEITQAIIPSSPLSLIPLLQTPLPKTLQRHKDGRAQGYHGGTDHPLH
jgi:hypothetical protein